MASTLNYTINGFEFKMHIGLGYGEWFFLSSEDVEYIKSLQS